MYLLQPGLTHVVNGQLPGFMPTPAMYKIKTNAMYKIKIKTGHSSVLHKHPQHPINPCDITPVHSKEGPTCAPSCVIGDNPCCT